MKKTVAIISSLPILLACLVTGSSAITGSLNNYDVPREITLPASSGCGDNKIGLYVDDYVSSNYASQKSKYKWDLLTGDSTVLHCCDAVMIDAYHKMFVCTVSDDAFARKKDDLFYGDDMTTSQYHSITNNTCSFDDTTTYALFTHNTKVKDPFYQTLIASDNYVIQFGSLD